MPVFEHNAYCNPQDVHDYSHSTCCLYCSSKLHTIELKDVWGETPDAKLLEIHTGTIKVYKEAHDLDDCYLNLRMESKSEDVWLQYCEMCGWWRILKDVSICAEEWQIWDIWLGASGVLKTLDVTDISQPVEEISKYLVARYEDRFSVNPRIFEDVVASVFRNLGHKSVVTGYTNDGGIDVILGNASNNFIGVQVKRYKNKIKVEQIRAFAGALMLSGYKNGIFVTTSDFQPAAIAAAKTYTAKTLPITLINSDQFYDALKMTQKQAIELEPIMAFINTGKVPLYDCGAHTPRNSL